MSAPKKISLKGYIPEDLPLEVELPNGDSIYFLTFEEMPIEDGQKMINAAAAIEKYHVHGASIDSIKAASEVFDAFGTFITCGLSPQDQEKYRQARIGARQVYNVLAPAVAEHYKGDLDDSARVAAARMSPPEVPQPQAPSPEPMFTARDLQGAVAEAVAEERRKIGAPVAQSVQNVIPDAFGGLQPGEASVSRI